MKKQRKKAVRYPWGQWFDKPNFLLKQGKDFHCQPHSMSVQIRTAAAARGVRVSVLIEDNHLNVSVRKRTKK